MKDGDQKVYSLIHTPSSTVINLFFDVYRGASARQRETGSSSHQKNPNSGGEAVRSAVQEDSEQDWNYTLHDITFHHLQEEDKYSHADLKKQFLSISTKNTEEELLKSFSLKSGIALQCRISKFGLYSSISKAIKKKYQKYILYGEVRHVFQRILEICHRYMLNLDKMKCSQCGRFAKFERRATASGTRVEVDYCVLNHGEDFYHESCLPSHIAAKFL